MQSHNYLRYKTYEKFRAIHIKLDNIHTNPQYLHPVAQKICTLNLAASNEAQLYEYAVLLLYLFLYPIILSNRYFHLLIQL